MKQIVKRVAVWLTLGCFLLFLPAFSALASENQIEQLSVNKPEVTVYYRTDQDAGQAEAWLGGEKLSLSECRKFSETGEAVNYFVLTDVSGSIDGERFQDIQSSLITFLGEIRDTDRLLLYTFGDDVLPVLTGNEDRAEAAEAIEELENKDQNTLLFEAVRQAADLIAEKENAEHQKWVLIIISDGEDYADNTKTAQSTTERLTDLGIPVYTIAVENDMGYDEQEVSRYQSEFSDMALKTGGTAWTPGRKAGSERSVLEALQMIQNSVLEEYRAVFRAANNRVSNQKEQFVLEFPNGASDVRDVLVNRGQPDQEPPGVIIQEKDSKTFRAVYSEPVEGADSVSNYLVTLNGESIGVEQVVKEEGTENAYLLIMKDELKNGDYCFDIRNVTDISSESNGLAESMVTVSVTTMRNIDTTAPEVLYVKQFETDGFLVAFSEEVQNADNNGNYIVTFRGEKVAVQQAILHNEEENEYLLLLNGGLKNGEYEVCVGGNITDASPEKNVVEETKYSVTVKEKALVWRDFFAFIARWWPAVLTVIMIFLLIGIAVFAKRLRNRKITVVDGELVRAEHVEQKVHVGVIDHSSSEKRQENEKTVVLWLSNGQDEPKRIEHTIHGSCFVGRSEQLCEIYCDDQMMSKQHFNLSVEADGNVFITDLESTNGTKVNGIRINGRKKLEPKDSIFAGNIHFIIEW